MARKRSRVEKTHILINSEKHKFQRKRVKKFISKRSGISHNSDIFSEFSKLKIFTEIEYFDRETSFRKLGIPIISFIKFRSFDISITKRIHYDDKNTRHQSLNNRDKITVSIFAFLISFRVKIILFLVTGMFLCVN